jgi:hypothetical protein
MDRAGRCRWLPVLGATALSLALAPAAGAHVVRTVGPYSVEIGWGNEPPIAGVANFVEVTVAADPGGPVADLGPDASVQVSFGDTARSFPLLPTEEPGEFHATVIPTRPGTYALDVDATIGDREISTGATCGDGTFDCVIPASEAQFPVADPTAGEVASRVENAEASADDAADDADLARSLAVVGIALAIIAFVVGTIALRRRKSD